MSWLKKHSFAFAQDCAGQKYKLGVCWVLFLVLAGLLYEFVVSSCQLWPSFTDLGSAFTSLRPLLAQMV